MKRPVRVAGAGETATRETRKDLGLSHSRSSWRSRSGCWSARTVTPKPITRLPIIPSATGWTSKAASAPSCRPHGQTAAGRCLRRPHRAAHFGKPHQRRGRRRGHRAAQGRHAVYHRTAGCQGQKRHPGATGHDGADDVLLLPRRAKRAQSQCAPITMDVKHDPQGNEAVHVL